MQTTNHTVLVTGGTAGIGLALAKQFHRAHNRVIVTGRNAAKFAALQAEFPAWSFEQADMSDLSALDHLAQAYPQISVLINNAGVQYNYELPDASVPAHVISEEIQTNLIGPMYLTKRMLPQLLAKPHAAIVNVTSSLSVMPKQNAATYSASKAGLHMFTKALRWQLEETSVKVFELIPPLVDTAMTTGRGRGKISAEALATEFWGAFAADVPEIRIGLAKQLLRLHRVLPNIVEQRMRRGA
ncbi:MAG: SDR family oxidoreductase [Roseiflexaceae bacterium]|nr:SDR family oxidoreductase [Roseiflexaceae bacterium]